MVRIQPSPGEEDAFRVAYLCAGFLNETLTEAEQIELADWVSSNMANQRLFEELTDPENIEKGMKQMRHLHPQLFQPSRIQRLVSWLKNKFRI